MSVLKTLLGLFFSLLVFELSAQQFQDPADSVFIRANNHYDQQQYNEAKVLYEELLERDIHSSAVFYNLGNACFKLDEVAYAILYYEKALQLDPDNSDIIHNIDFANTFIVDKIIPLPQLFLKKWWFDFVNYYDLNDWAVNSLILFWLFFILMAIYLISRKIILKKVAFYAGIIVLFLSIIAFVSLSQKKGVIEKQQYAIVFEPTITVKSSPNRSSVDLFVIHEGLKVELLEKGGQWYKIKIANGSIGWIPAETIKKI